MVKFFKSTFYLSWIFFAFFSYSAEKRYQLDFIEAGLFELNLFVQGLWVHPDGKQAMRNYQVTLGITNPYVSEKHLPLKDLQDLEDGNDKAIPPIFLWPGQNRIEVIVKDEKENAIYQKSTDLEVGGTVHRENGVLFALSEMAVPPSKNVFVSLSHLIRNQNKRLSHEFRIRSCFILEREDSLAFYDRNRITISTIDVRDQTLIDKVVFHETAHAVEDQLSHKKPNLWKRWLSFYERLTELDKEDLFSLFKEGSYCASPTFGHPKSSAHELFASAATVQAFWPSVLARNILTLSPKERALANSIVAFVRREVAFP